MIACQALISIFKARYLRLIFDLLEASAPTVIYEAASSLTALTNNPVAVKAAASKFIDLSIKESDNNVKLIVLDRVDQLRQKNEGVIDDLTMEILRVLSSTDLDVRRKALSIALEMVSSKNVEDVVMLLKKELAKTVDEQYEKVNWNLNFACHDNVNKKRRTMNTVLCLFIRFITAQSSFPKSLQMLSSFLWTLSQTSTAPLLWM